MSKIQQNLIQEINNSIKQNNVGAITGLMLNGVLNDMTTTLSGSDFLFPAEPGLSDSDAGKLVMNDGSGTAKVYELSAATSEQLGKWIIQPLHFSDISSNSLIQITTKDNSVTAVRSNWIAGRTMPTNISTELGYIRDYLQSNSALTGLSFNVSTDGSSLTIQELTFMGTVVFVSGFDNFPLTIVCDSVAALPRTPAYFPLGKLVGVDGNQAIISCNPIQEYTLAVPGSINVMNSLFSYNNDIPLKLQSLEDLAKHIILPADGGAVAPVDIINTFIGIEGSFLSIFRFHVVGIAIASTNTSVTVLNLQPSTLIGSIIIKLARSGAGAINNAVGGK